MAKTRNGFEIKSYFSDVELDFFTDYRTKMIHQRFRIEAKKDGNFMRFSCESVTPLVSKEFMNYIRVLTRPPHRLRLRSAVIRHFQTLRHLVLLEEEYGITIVYDKLKAAISFGADSYNWNRFMNEIEGRLSFECEYFSVSQSKWIGLPPFLQTAFLKSFKTKEFFEVETDDDNFLQVDLNSMKITDHSGRLKDMRLVISDAKSSTWKRDESSSLFSSPHQFLKSITNEECPPNTADSEDAQIDQDLAQSMAKIIPLIHFEDIEKDSRRGYHPVVAHGLSGDTKKDDELKVPRQPDRSISPAFRDPRLGSAMFEGRIGRSGSIFPYASVFRMGGEGSVHVSRSKEWSLFAHFPGLQKQYLRNVVLMGSSIAIEYGRQENYDLDGIYHAVKYFSTDKISVSVTIPQHRTKVSSATQRPPTKGNKRVIDMLRREESLIEVPVGFDESLAAIEIARTRDAVLITNEKIACEIYPELAQFKSSMVFPFTFDENILLIARQINKTYWFETVMVKKHAQS